MAAKISFKKGNLSENSIEEGEIRTDESIQQHAFSRAKRKRKSRRKNIFTPAFVKFIIFVLFLVVLSFVTLGMTSYSQWHLTKALAIAFIERRFSDDSLAFMEISTVPEIYKFLEEIVFTILFATGEDNKTSRTVLQENLLLGVPRLRQIRVYNGSCKVHRDLRSQISTCFDEYSNQIEDKEPFGIKVGTAWTYHTEEEIDGSSHWGLLQTYSGAGNYLDISPTGAKEQMHLLKQHNWITRGTRAIFLDFTIYNANINIFSIVKFVWEMPAAGGIWPSKSFYTLRLLRYVTVWDYSILAFEFVFCCLTAYYLYEEILEISTQKIAYFKSKWNLLDTLLLLLSLFSIGFSVYRTILINNLLKDLLRNPNRYPNFHSLGFWQTQSNNIVAVLVFFCWIKVFKYLSFNDTMTHLSTTLAKCAKDVGGFAIMFFIIFLAYAQLGYLLFGTQLAEFSSVFRAIFTLLRVILQDFDFHSLEMTNRIMGPIYFVSYVFFVFFVLMNMFLAIINDTYTEVKSSMADETDVDKKFEFIKFYKDLCEKFRILFHMQPNPDTDLQTAEVSKRKDDTEETGRKLKSQKKSEEQPKMISRTKPEDTVSRQSISVEDFERMSNRVDDLTQEVEQVQEVILTKMSNLITKMEFITFLERNNPVH